MKTIIIFIFVILVLATNCNIAIAQDKYVKVPVCFETISTNEVKAKSLYKNMDFQVIPKGQMDNQTEWYSEHIVNIGDTITIKGGQSMQYVKIIDIKSEYIEVLNNGWAKGIGEYKIKEKIEFGCKK